MLLFYIYLLYTLTSLESSFRISTNNTCPSFYPYSVEKHLEILFKITHAGKFYTAVQALSLIFTISLAKQTVSDRFYRTLYESMLDNRLLITNKQTQYLNLLFKAVRADTDMRRVKAFVKRMIQIAGHHQPPFICGLFYLLNQVGYIMIINNQKERCLSPFFLTFFLFIFTIKK